MKLYLLTTRKEGRYYVIAENELIARERLEMEMRNSYGTSGDFFEVIQTELLTEELHEFPKGKLHFSDGNARLIICNKQN